MSIALQVPKSQRLTIALLVVMHHIRTLNQWMIVFRVPMVTIACLVRPPQTVLKATIVQKEQKQPPNILARLVSLLIH
jgi:hypothetical protein